MKIKSASDVRKYFQETIDHIHYTKDSLVITKNNKPWVMVQPLPDNDKELQKIIDAGQKAKKKAK